MIPPAARSPCSRPTVHRSPPAVPVPCPRVLILYNEPVLPAGHPDFESEHEILHTVEVVGKTLAEAGFGVTRLGVSTDAGVLLHGLREQRPDVVFNLFEGTA